jgi:hypothetical protein
MGMNHLFGMVLGIGSMAKWEMGPQAKGMFLLRLGSILTLLRINHTISPDFHNDFGGTMPWADMF